MQALTCFLLFSVSIGAWMVAVAQDDSSERAALQNVIESLMDAWNKHDAHAFSMVFAEDAEFTNVRGVSASDREAIEKFHEPRSGHISRIRTKRRTKRRFASSSRMLPLWM